MNNTSNSTSLADNGIVVGGGYLFLITFGGTSLFFFGIMTFVCCAELKKYRERKPRQPYNTDGVDYPKQTLSVPPVKIPTVDAPYPRQTFKKSTPPTQNQIFQVSQEISVDSETCKLEHDKEAEIQNSDVNLSKARQPHKLPPLNLERKTVDGEVTVVASVHSSKNSFHNGAKIAFTKDESVHKHEKTKADNTETTSIEPLGSSYFSERL